MKTCSKCQRRLSVERFSPDRRNASGLQARCKECRRQSMFDYRQENPEKTRDIGRRSYAKHREQRIADVTAYQRRNRVAVAKRKREHALANRDHIREYAAAYREANRERIRFHRNNYDHRKRANGGSLTHEEWVDIQATFDGRCAYCGSTELIELDHLTPIVKGGQHSIDNIVPACRHCNRSKRSASLLRFLLYRQAA